MKMITKENMLWSINKFSQPIFQEVYGGWSGEFVCWSWGLRGWRGYVMYAICYLFIKLKHFFASIEFQKFGPVGIPIIILVLELFPVACCNEWQGWT